MRLRLKIGLSSSDFMQNDGRSARNLTVTARMPEDRSKTFKNLQNLQIHIHLCAYTCGAQ
eukprot:14837800-Heterocapsa_arctica.AAC.1